VGGAGDGPRYDAPSKRENNMTNIFTSKQHFRSAVEYKNIKTNHSARRCIENTTFKPIFKIVKF
jgi:hypothetical protein